MTDFGREARGMFRLREHGTTVGAEIRGGLVTFLTLSYILFV
jgi:xanthine/uracil/vitamin C permease (AzgA family)